MKLADRIAKHVIRDPAKGCWLWTGATDPDGYGQISVNGKTEQAHIASYEDAKGSVPDGLELDHKCETRNCVNPEHLEAVTHEENVRRMAVAQKRLRLIRGGKQDLSDKDPGPAIDETEAELHRILGIPSGIAQNFRLNDVTAILPAMLWVTK